MKKIISLLLAICMVFLFVSCQNPTPSRGTIDENVYKNDFLKFEFTKPDSWVYYTDEEIADKCDVNNWGYKVRYRNSYEMVIIVYID